MRARWWAVAVAALALAGCADNANPSLAAPKLVLAARPDGDVEAFIHAAFGERLYDRVSLRIDNGTAEIAENVFSLERALNESRFYFDVAAETARETYVLRGTATFLPQEEQFEIAFHAQDGTWSDPQDFASPFERVMSLQERVEG